MVKRLQLWYDCIAWIKGASKIAPAMAPHLTWRFGWAHRRSAKPPKHEQHQRPELGPGFDLPLFVRPFLQRRGGIPRRAYSEWYAQKHPKPSPATIHWINSHVPERCPRCGCPLISRHAIPEAGMIRYACLGCKKTFTPITGTIFDHFRIMT